MGGRRAEGKKEKKANWKGEKKCSMNRQSSRPGWQRNKMVGLGNRI